ncbi:MAG TPA: AmpG family muropeptide MFS transporter [Gammaproteobacteria bacterium]|nr:AmpG family muropeptide MFS transporter [Gammaproteobacteria bacterium]
MTATDHQPTRLSWGEALRVYTRARVVGMLFLGFSAGLPFLLVFSTLSAWLSEAGLTRTVIGFFSWVGITYSIKVLWAPVIDRLPLPGLTRVLGRRRSWMLAGQCGIALGLMGMAATDPVQQVGVLAGFALLVAFSSATQDVCIDAYRIEAVVPEWQGAMAAMYILGYRLALLVAGAGALFIADGANFPLAYLAMAALMGVGIGTVLVIREPEATVSRDTFLREQRVVDYLERSAHLSRRRRMVTAWFIGAVVAPFVDFFSRKGALAVAILLFVALFRISDITMGVMANPFYLDLGFSLSEIATVTKFFGFFMTILGAGLGGVLVARFGIMRPLVLGAVMVAATNLLFAWLAATGPSLPGLAVVISADNLSGGLAVACFIAYLSSLTNSAYTATQYALFSSLMTLPAKFLGGFAGVVVDGYGYVSFFIYASALGIPAILLALYLARAAPPPAEVGPEAGEGAR